VLATVAAAMFALAGIASAAELQPIKASGSAKQVLVTGASPGQSVKLKRKGKTVSMQKAGPLGGVVFRGVTPGKGYMVQAGGTKTKTLRVFGNGSKPASTKTYKQELPAGGYGYLKTRDGTKLAIDVHLPGPADEGPYPTLVEYSGYGYANPAGPQSGIQPVAALLGFAVVDINMRGTGCSGGAFDYFERQQSLDGYDAIETVANQPWALHHKVGMMGISYGGISQLFVAATQPPSLSAITPISVIDNTQTTLYPGGILNTGFALQWGQERVDDSQPATATTGQGWAYQRIQGGDTICAANQDLHPEAVNLIKKIRQNRYYHPKVADPLSPVTFVHKINVPVFMACQWTDEQTGGHCPTLPAQFTGTKKKWFTFTNGTHIDSLDPETFNRWYDFMKIYVAKQAPITNAALIQGAAPVIYQEAMGISGVTLPPDPIQAQPTLQGAKDAFEAQKPVKVMFDNGAGGTADGQPKAGFEQDFSRFPVPGTKAKSFYLAKKGKLTGKAPKRSHAEGFKADPHATPPTNFTGDTASGANGLWTETPPYNWAQGKKGTSVAYVSKPLTKDTTVVGGGAVQLWVRSSKPNVDLQATVSEVRPDGKETFVQNGWVRANERKLDRKKSTRLAPVLSLRQRDVKPMPKHRFVKVTVPLYYQGHAYRQGSRIRVAIAAPNGSQPIWSFKFAQPHKSETKVAIKSSKKHRSKLLLPVVSGVDVPTGLPPCPGLRGEPCRDYVATKNHHARM
jgi:predicted acyl esterase